MKKKLVILTMMCVAVLGGCGNSGISQEEYDKVVAEKDALSEQLSEINNSSKETVVESKEDVETFTSSEPIDGFQKPEYEKFNSYASDNGLGGTPIYIEGKVLNQTNLGDSTPPVLALVVEQEDGKRWCVSLVSDSEIEGIKGKKVRVFGTYQGYSDVLNLPAIGIAMEDIDLMDKARLEIEENGEYNTVWSFIDYAKNEIEKEENVEKSSEKKEVCNLYETGDLESITLEDITFKIPKTLYNDTKSINEWTYYYYNDLMLATRATSENSMTNEALILERDSVAEGIVEASNGRVISADVIEISGKQVVQISAEEPISGKDYYLNTILFIYKSKLYNIGWVYEKESNIDYSEDYAALKESIVIGKAEEIAKEETETQQQNNESKESDTRHVPTMGEQNALSKAKDYLEFTAFSYKGLIEQLEYEKFSHEEAVYGADNCGADWDEQAVKKAKEYLEFTSFSKSGLIEQLEYEGFTHEQAIYGAEKNGY